MNGFVRSFLFGLAHLLRGLAFLPLALGDAMANAADDLERAARGRERRP